MREMKREEPEMVSMAMATPKTGTDTIKRAEMRVADSDTFKGRVLKLPESETVRKGSSPLACLVGQSATEML